MALAKRYTEEASEWLRTVIESALSAKGVSGRQASMDIVGHDGLIRDIRAGRLPSIDKLRALSDYFDLQLYFGPRLPEFDLDDPRLPDLGEQKGQVAPPLSPDLARYLGLPEGASVAEAIQAIETRAATTPSTTTLSRDEVAAMMRAETESLRDEIRSLRHSPTDAADPPARPRPEPDPDLLERLACVASTMFRDANVTLPPASLTAEATIMFNDLVTRVSDLSDPDEIAVAMPLVEYNLKRRLKDATVDPGAGKHGA